MDHLFSFDRYGIVLNAITEMLDDYAIQDALTSFALGMLVYWSTMFYAFSDIFSMSTVCMSSTSSLKASHKMPTYYDMLPQVIWNQLVIVLPSMLLCAHYKLSVSQEMSPFVESLHPAVRWWCSFVVGATTHEVTFYAFHRFLLHSKWGYEFLAHTVHHSAKTYSAISALYMSLQDFFVEIVVLFLAPVMAVCYFSLTDRAGV